MRRLQHQYSLSRTIRAILACTGLICLSGVAIGGESVVSSASSELKNLARMNCGARIERITPAGRLDVVATMNENNQSAAPLIMDDQTVSCPLEEGQTSFVISLPQSFALNRFTFVNENADARGDIRIAVSNYHLPAASPKWTTVDGSVSFTHKRIFNFSMLGVEAKYVRISFEVEKGGRIAGFGLYGDETVAAFAERNPGMTKVSNFSSSKNIIDVLNYNFANLYAQSRVVYVSSGRQDLAKRMIDDDAYTSFEFAPADERPTVVVELAGLARVHRVSALYEMQPGRLDVYLLSEIQTSPPNLDGIKPVASIVDHARRGKAAVDFDPHGARYVAFVWAPDKTGAKKDGFEVAEVCAFGSVTFASLNTAAPLDLFASNLNPPGEGSHDFSNRLGTLAEPPVLAVVSP
jgi:hypothetical protein